MLSPLAPEQSISGRMESNTMAKSEVSMEHSRVEPIYSTEGRVIGHFVAFDGTDMRIEITSDPPMVVVCGTVENHNLLREGDFLAEEMVSRALYDLYFEGKYTPHSGETADRYGLATAVASDSESLEHSNRNTPVGWVKVRDMEWRLRVARRVVRYLPTDQVNEFLYWWLPQLWRD